MYGRMTAAGVAAGGVIGVMAAAALVPAQAAQAAASVRAATSVRVPCDPATLAAAVTAAAGGAALSLAPGCNYVLTAGLPVVTRSLTIFGHGATLERSDAPGTPAFTILTVNDGGQGVVSVALSRLNFRNGNGAIALIDGGELTVTGGTFTGNSTAGDGGAIDIEDSDNISRINGARFIANSAAVGGAIDNDSGQNGELDISHCSFLGNHASSGGGAVLNESYDGSVSDSTFRRNTAAQSLRGIARTVAVVASGAQVASQPKTARFPETTPAKTAAASTTAGAANPSSRTARFPGTARAAMAAPSTPPQR
jgi:hypothetical protein